MGRPAPVSLDRTTPGGEDADGPTHLRLRLAGNSNSRFYPLDKLPYAWQQQTVMRKEFFAPAVAAPYLAIRMRTLRHIWNITPSKAAELVLEHYYRAG